MTRLSSLLRDALRVGALSGAVVSAHAGSVLGPLLEWAGDSGPRTQRTPCALALAGSRAVVGLWLSPVPGGAGSGEVRMLVPDPAGWRDAGVSIRSSDPACLEFGLAIQVHDHQVIVGSGCGIVHAYDLMGESLQPRWTWQAPCPGAALPLAVEGERLLVGLPGLAGGRGGGQVLDVSSGTPSVVATLEAPQGMSSLGRSGGMSGASIVLSAEHRADVSGAATWRSTGTDVWVFDAVLTPTGAVGVAIFGCSSDIEGNVVAVGARDDNGAGHQSGACFIFERNAAGAWVQRAKVTLSESPLSNQEMGACVRVRDGRVWSLAGGNLENGAQDRGRLLVFDRVGATWQASQTLRCSDSGNPVFIGPVAFGPGESVAMAGWESAPPFGSARCRVAVFGPLSDCDDNGENDLAQCVRAAADDRDWSGVPDCCEQGIPCPKCAGDFDGNAVVDGADIALLLLDFGPCSRCAPDLDGNAIVDSADVALLLLDFGACP